jgi:hypothetical protein
MRAKQILDEQKVSPHHNDKHRFTQNGSETQADATASSETVDGTAPRRRSNRVIFKRKNVMVDDRNFID